MSSNNAANTEGVEPTPHSTQYVPSDVGAKSFGSLPSEQQPRGQDDPHLNTNASKADAPQEEEEEAITVPELLPNFKTQLCAHVLSLGSCPFGKECTYAHDPSELKRSPFYRTKMCPKVQKGLQCCDGSLCHFAHSEDQLLEPPTASVAKYAHIKTPREKKVPKRNKQKTALRDFFDKTQATEKEAPRSPAFEPRPAPIASNLGHAPNHLGIPMGSQLALAPPGFQMPPNTQHPHANPPQQFYVVRSLNDVAGTLQPTAVMMPPGPQPALVGHGPPHPQLQQPQLWTGVQQTSVQYQPQTMQPAVLPVLYSAPPDNQCYAPVMLFTGQGVVHPSQPRPNQ